MKLTKEAVMTGKVSLTNIKASDIEEFGTSVGYEYDQEQSKQSNLDALRVHIMSGVEAVTVSSSTEVMEPTPAPTPASVEPQNWLTRRKARIEEDMRWNPTPDGKLRAEDLPPDAPAFMRRRVSKGGE